VWWRKLGEVESEYTSHNFSLFVIFLAKNIEIGGHLTKFRQNNFAQFFWDTMYFAAVLNFFARTYRWESADQAAAVTAPTVEDPALLIKYPQTSDPCCPLFTGGKMCQIFAQISTSVVFGPPYLELGRFTGKQKQTCQGLMICLPPHQNWVR